MKIWSSIQSDSTERGSHELWTQPILISNASFIILPSTHRIALAAPVPRYWSIIYDACTLDNVSAILSCNKDICAELFKIIIKYLN